MPSMNQAIIMGHLGKDAETQYTQSGAQVTKFSVATTRAYKQQGSTEWTEVTHWHQVVAWGLNEKLTQMLVKGALVQVVGRIETRSYEKDGQTRYVTEIIAEKVHWLRFAQQQNGGSARDEQPRQSQPPQQQQQRRQSAPQRQVPYSPPPDDYGNYDDVPF